MAPVMASGEGATGGTGAGVAERPPRLTTTLYDLIAALQAMVGPDDDALVVATMMHLLQSGRLTFPGKAERRIRP
jgi:hypothetical protein